MGHVCPGVPRAKLRRVPASPVRVAGRPAGHSTRSPLSDATGHQARHRLPPDAAARPADAGPAAMSVAIDAALSNLKPLRDLAQNWDINIASW